MVCVKEVIPFYYFLSVCIFCPSVEHFGLFLETVKRTLLEAFRILR